MLSNIAERGSYYLFKFTSGQFTFEIEEEDLHVMDHHTGHIRPVSSLSGGETFLASLSLAFAVADILSQNAPLESLFIDEGFGILFSGMGILIGLVMWDRRTAISPVQKKVIFKP